VDIKRRVQGPEHRDTLYAINGLADTYTAAGKYGQAEATFRQLLEVQKRVLGAEDFNTLRTLQDFALVYLLQGRYAMLWVSPDRTRPTRPP
jgi:hypothetical protein